MKGRLWCQRGAKAAEKHVKLEKGSFETLRKDMEGLCNPEMAYPLVN